MGKKICFVSQNSLPLLTSSEKLQYVGGAELMSVLIGEELAKREYKIFFITYNEEIKKKNDKGIKIITTFSNEDEISKFNKIRIIWRALKNANADIYFQASGISAIIPLFCLIHKKKYVKWLGSDSDVQLHRIKTNYTILSRFLAYLDIKLADKIISQNIFQKKMIEEKFRKENVLIKNPIIILYKKPNKKDYILWVSTVRSIKQPQLFLKIAQELPDTNFVMIGGPYAREKEFFEKIKKEARSISNLKFLGFVPHHKIQRYYENALLFINTSKLEGFPNTFLEAWINYTPVISLNVDPNEVIRENKLGFHSKNFNQLIKDIRELSKNEKLRKQMGLNCRKYVVKNHDVKKIADQFEIIIKSIK